jgi:acyl-phosphate glycerol 3-phosphate acyltransferase
VDWGALGIVAGAYALGCLASAYYLVRACTGQDLRLIHSGNVGARNASRVLGPWGFLAVTVCDMGKAALACAIARWAGGGPWVVAAAFWAVIVGHAFPVQLGFRGGKGVNCLGGGCLVLAPWAVVWFVAGLVPSLALRRGLEFASGVGFAVAPIALALMGAPQALGVAVACALVIALLFRDPLGVHRRVAAPAVAGSEAA